MPKPICIVSAATLSLLVMTGAVSAEPFGKAGANVFSAENLMGIGRANVDPERGGDTDTTYFSFFATAESHTPFDVPKLAYDRFVGDGLTVGGFFSYSDVTDRTGDTESDSNILLIGPRIGYGAGLGDRVGIWARGGITFYTADFDFGLGSGTISGVGLNLEALFTLHVTPGFMFTVGPVVALPLSGKAEAAGGEEGLKFRNIGVMVGVAGIV